ncbi:MAG: alpha/beta fold hydrolase [Myxococcota bacterium]|nr:alpha/beta fold hydrolase [Myxococcota bacterium]
MKASIAALLCCALCSACVSFHQGAMPGEPENASFVELEGARVRYVDLGNPNAPPLVFIHGFASALETWATVWPIVKQDYRVIALDLKGFGWTDRPEGDYSPEAQARIVLALMDHLGVNKSSLIAHSWGSSVALQVALLAPNRVERIALYDAWVYFEQLPTFFIAVRADGLGEMLTWLFYKERPAEKMTQAFFDPTLVTEAFAEEVEHALDRPGTEAAALAAIRGQRYEDIQDRYSEIKHPVLLLWGREDKVTRLHFGERLLKQLPNARLLVYPQCGHFPMLEAVGASNHALRSFLDEGPATPPAPESPKTPLSDTIDAAPSLEN